MAVFVLHSDYGAQVTHLRELITYTWKTLARLQHFSQRVNLDHKFSLTMYYFC